jgi:aminopeptidase N
MTVAVGRLVRVGERNAGDVAIEAFAVPRTRNDAREGLGRAEEILRFYTQEFGPPPYPSLILALLEGVAPGGHSPPGMVLVARRPMLLRGRLREDPANFGDVPDFFLSHELSHQWWGHGVAGQNYHERWISEGFAQYAAALWVRHSQGEQAFRSLLARMAEWALRRNGEGPISLGYRLGHLKGDRQIFRAVVYDKGALVLHMLRGIVGEDAFRRALTRLQAEYRFQKIGTSALRAALENASAMNLSAFFDAWVYGTELPTLSVARRSEPGGPPHRTRVEVKASNLPGPVPLELSLVHKFGRETRRVVLDPGGGAWAIETPGPPGKLEVNADGGLLARVRKE